MNLDGLTLYVSSTASNGVVGSDTLLHFSQMGSRVLAHYNGGSVRRGYLVGDIKDEQLRFRYTQLETSGEIQGGNSVCDVERLPDGRTRITEHFTWRTRQGSGDNIFDELPRPRPEPLTSKQG